MKRICVLILFLPAGILKKNLEFWCSQWAPTRIKWQRHNIKCEPHIIKWHAITSTGNAIGTVCVLHKLPRNKCPSASLFIYFMIGKLLMSDAEVKRNRCSEEPRGNIQEYESRIETHDAPKMMTIAGPRVLVKSSRSQVGSYECICSF